ncbi:MAG: zinc metallopeptidase [Gammaproteobacteria bacterium]|nr:MAG: zinc metallopeptidase [Gammaproteobacteria bacterium]UCH41504.1 MAG: zinc metallopeptidase [Gammaproteobacteria bacterium]
MIYVAGIIVILVLIYGPQLWVQWVLNHYNRQDEDNFPGTGGELARHLLDRYELQEISVEITELGDHYDPMARAVRLTRDKFEGKTLTAITVAAHECGHALQHAAGEPMFILRTRLARVSLIAQRVGSFLLFAAPFSVLITRLPSAAVFNITGAFLIMGSAVVIHLLTLPVEIDASYKKALPLLASGYLSRQQMPAARRILRAAAWTYVAASLASLLNFWRWLAVLRR